MAVRAHKLSKSFGMRAERRTSFKERVVRGKAPEPKLFWALRDASFSVPRGSSLGIIGQNGSGKSTALKVLTGIYRPTSGFVEVNGSVSALLEVGAGFHPELTGRENIRLNATILGFTGKEIDRLMDRIIEFADIGEHIDSPIKHYSSGMYVRLGFAVAVMVRPEILIVDEVFAVGDEEFQRKCFDYLYELRRANTAMIIVSHGLGSIEQLCDHALWLDHGSVKEIGPSHEVTRSYLESVNAKEAARHVPDLDQEPAQTAWRGSGEVRVVAVELLNAEGSSTNFLLTGGPGVFRVHYRADQQVARATMSISIEDLHGRVLLQVSSRDQELFDIPTGKGYLDFQVTELFLAGGNYVIKTVTEVDGHVVEALEEGIEFTVRSPRSGMAGSFLQPGEWRHIVI
ncbi:MAG TPA: ABC transporter ATP-binding protein [Actinomycetota bacterium]|nr:ABC transporter ATP-binding protein [Actinomycetota bacterium]